jgi:HEAT repeat protein
MPLIRRNHPSAAEVKIPEPPTLAALLADLASAEIGVRRSAALALGSYPEAAAALCTAVAAEEQAFVREAIFTALIQLGTKTVAQGLMPLLRSEDAGLRNGAIEALKTMPDTAASCVFESLKDGNRDVRIFGVDILGALASSDSPRWLIRVIEEETDVNVCAAAVDGLTECGNDEAVAPLRRLLERFPDQPFLEFSVQTALTRIAAA